MFRSKCGSFVPYCSGGYQKCTGHKKGRKILYPGL